MLHAKTEKANCIRKDGLGKDPWLRNIREGSDQMRDIKTLGEERGGCWSKKIVFSF